MVQHYVLASAGLFYSYWTGHPCWVFAGFLLLRLYLFGIADAGALMLNRPVWPLSLLAGCAVGGSVAWQITKPGFRFHSWTFALRALSVAAIYTGTLVMWQLAPQKVWNYLVCAAIQFLLQLVGLFIVPHHQSWGGEYPRYVDYVVAMHFFFSWFLLNVVFVPGQSARPDLWPFYWVVGFASLAMIYLTLHTLCIRITVSKYKRYWAVPFDPNRPPDGIEIVKV